MKKNSPRFFNFFKAGLFLVGFVFYTSLSIAQVNLTISDDTTISAVDPPEEVDNVTYNNSSKLTITGTLIVNGDFDMDQNDASLELGDGARLIVYGNFIAANKVNITLRRNSYFFVYGNFSKGGSSNQDVVIIDNAKIYILGNGDNWGGNLTSCGGTYGGTTTNENDDCDFGTEDDYENNQDDFPDDLVEQLNCYDLSAIRSSETFNKGDATFSVDEIPGVDYQWQEKALGTDSWVGIGQNSPTLNLSNLSLTDSGNQYRVKVTPNEESNCKISISKNVLLKVQPIPQIKNESPEIVCSGEAVEFRVEENADYNYSWHRTESGGNNFFHINDWRYSGTNTSTMIVASESWMNNQNFRVEITNSEGKKAYSNVVNMQVNESPGGIWSSPENIVACEGADTYFNINSSGENIQWQVSIDEGANWKDLQNNTSYNNVSASNLNITNVPLDFNNNLYRVKLYNENCIIYSDPARLRVDPDPITEQPQDVYVEFGANAIFQAETQGGNLSYQWQTFSSKWYNLQDGQHYHGTQTRILELIEVGYWPVDGTRYRMVVTNENGCISVSEEAILNIGQNPCEDVTTWTGTEDTNWNNINNWSCNTLPTLETNVLILENLTSGNYPEINPGTNAFAKDLVIENTASVLVNNNWLRIAGDLQNNGVLNTETGSVSFQGSLAQIIPIAAFQNNRIRNLRINNTSGVTSEALIEVTGELLVENGSFDTSNKLTLISDATQTALIDGSGNGEIIGKVTMQRYLDKAFGYKYFSSPFQNSKVGDFAPYMDFEDPDTEFPNFYRYNENRNVDINDSVRDATGWEIYTNIQNSLNITEGYALNFGTSNDAQTIELIGNVNNGPIPVRQLENNHREYTKGFHLVGNPYPSPIDWNASQGWTRNNIDDGIYFFTASDDSQYTGTYTAYVNNISTADSRVDGRSSNIIPSMQGFFIKVSDSDTKDLVTGSFGMDNNVRINDFNQEFLRTREDLNPLIRLEAGFKNTNRKDPMVIYFSSYGTPNFEKEMDAHKLMNTDPAVPSFYNLTEDKKELSINAIPFPESRSYKKIPLGIKADQNGEMKIDLTSLENLSPNFNIYLIDHAKGIGQNLSRKPEYSFSIKEGIHNSRFELMFSEEEIISPAIAFNEPFDVEVEDGNVVVKLNLEENQQGILRASTMTGQILEVKEAAGKDRVIFEGITSNGVYIINLQLGKAQYAKKVVIKK